MRIQHFENFLVPAEALLDFHSFWNDLKGANLHVLIKWKVHTGQAMLLTQLP
jgi:hypothetical protein